MKWPWKMRESDAHALRELQHRVEELEDDVTSLTEWRVKLLAKLRGQHREQLARAAGDDRAGDPAAAGDSPNVVGDGQGNGTARFTKDQLRAFARARGIGR